MVGGQDHQEVVAQRGPGGDGVKNAPDLLVNVLDGFPILGAGEAMLVTGVVGSDRCRKVKVRGLTFSSLTTEPTRRASSGAVPASASDSDRQHQVDRIIA